MACVRAIRWKGVTIVLTGGMRWSLVLGRSAPARMPCWGRSVPACMPCLKPCALTDSTSPHGCGASPPISCIQAGQLEEADVGSLQLGTDFGVWTRPVPLVNSGQPYRLSVNGRQKELFIERSWQLDSTARNCLCLCLSE